MAGARVRDARARGRVHAGAQGVRRLDVQAVGLWRMIAYRDEWYVTSKTHLYTKIDVSKSLLIAFGWTFELGFATPYVSLEVDQFMCSKACVVRFWSFSHWQFTTTKFGLSPSDL